MANNLEKYLAKYAEPIVGQLANFPKLYLYKNVVVIPAYQESSDFFQRFKSSSLAKQSVLMILVINQPLKDQDSGLQEVLLNTVVDSGQPIWENQQVKLVEFSNVKFHVLVVDSFSEGLPDEQGVGLARKIGADIACELYNQKRIVSKWIHSTDADARLPANYFDKQHSTDKHDALLCFDFSHTSSNLQIHNANQQYELALRYYVAGLAFAGSNYAFHTIGSLLAINCHHYASVRGFPKKSAGEDFYLINKLAKVGRIQYVDDIVVELEARTSTRVPFGTGPAVSRIIALNQEGLPYCYYHPKLFLLLKLCLTHFAELWKNRNDIQSWLSELPAEIAKALVDVHLPAFVEKQIESKQIQFNKQLDVWFDAFKTLKFIHALRDYGFDNIPLQDALTLAPFITKDTNMAEVFSTSPDNRVLK